MSASKTIAGLLCFCLLTGLTGIVNAQTPMPLQVEVGVNPPYPSRLDHLTRPNQVVLRVYNNSAETQRVWFRISITGMGTAGGISVVSNALEAQPVIPIALTPPMFPRTIYYSELENYGTFSSDMFNITVPPQLQAAVNNGYLPAGNYQICVEAIDAISGLVVSSPGPNNNCATFEVRSIPPPEIVNPADNERLGVSNPVIVRWSQNFATLPPDISYELDFRRIPEGSPLLQEMRNAGSESSLRQDRFNALEDGTTATVMGAAFIYNTIQDIIEFEEGGVYALRIRARSEEIYIQNGGFSNVVLFYYGASADDACESPDIQAQIVYPVAGDTLPFVYLPIMTNFTPHCDNITRTVSRLNVSNALPGVFQKVNAWPDGPSQFLRNYLQQRNLNLSVWMPDDRPEFAHTINLAALSSDPYCGLLERGKEHQAEGDITFTYRDGMTNRNETQEKRLSQLAGNNRFYTGMPKPLLKQPARRDTLCIAQPVALEFSTGTAPQQILPLFRVLDIEGRQNASTCAMLVVREKLVLQVARDEQFQNIVYRGFKKIQAASYNPDHAFNEDAYTFEAVPEPDWEEREYDTDALLDRIFKDFSFDFDASGLPSPAGEYFWRVGWVKEPTQATEAPGTNRINSEADLTGLTDNDFYWFSDVSRFVLQEIDCESGGTPATPVTATDTQLSDCLQNILFPMEGVNQTPYASALQPGAVIQAGHMEVTLKEVNGSGGRYSGTAEAPIDLGIGLGALNVKFNFNNILINSDLRLIEGQFTARQDANPYSNGALSWLPRTVSGVTVSVPDAPTPQQAAALVNSIESSTERLISQLSGTPTGMPVGARVSNGDDFSVHVGIEDMTLKPNGAEMKMVAGLQLPGEFADQPVVFGMDKVMFSSRGIGEARLYLANDWTIGDAGDWQVQIEGLSGNTDTINATYVEWDCYGFKALNFKGSVVFHRDALVPENVTSGEVESSGQVRGSFRTRITRNQGWIAGLHFDRPFQFTALPGFGITVSQAWLDFSETQNPQDMRYPAGYDFRWLSPETNADEPVTTPPAAALLNTWTGFYLKELSVRLPKDFADNGGNRIGFSVSDFMIDRNDKVSGRIAATNLIAAGSPGTVGSWAFTLDEVSVGIVQSATISGLMRGQVGLPIFEAGEYLVYRALLSANTDNGQVNFEFGITPPEGRSLHIPMWDIARMTLAPTTRVNIKIGAEPRFDFRLDGQIDFNGTPRGADFVRLEFPGVKVENLVFENDRLKSGGISIQDGANWRSVWSLASPQKSMNGFPLSLERLILEPSGEDEDNADLRLGFVLKLNLAGDFSAQADISVLADLGFREQGRISRFQFREFLPPQHIKVEAEMNGLALMGELNFKRINQNGTFREGTEGKLRVKIPGVGQIWLAAEFGTVKNTNIQTPVWDTRDFYPYFYVDGLFKSESGIDLLPPSLVLYGLGGGVRYHMRTTAALPDQNARYAAALLASNGSQDQGSSESNQPPANVQRSEAQYEPHFDTFIGVTFRVVLGNTGGGQAYNLDVALSAEISQQHGLTRLGIDGYLNVMQSMDATGNAPVRAEVHIAYNKHPESGLETVQGNILVYVNVMEILKGVGPEDRFIDARFYADNDARWYFYMGNPYQREINGYPGGQVAGLNLSIGGANLATLTSYIMIGQDIPGYLPPIDQEVEAVLHGGQLSQGGLNGQTRSREDGGRAPDYSQGEGFAFGSRFSVSTRFEFLVFYAQLRMKLGFDVNITRDLNRVCAPTAITPGVNGWYAQGQMFAGLFGEMGLFVDLWFFKGNVKFIELAAAVSMKAKLPNPEYFQGRAGLSYSVLGGAVAGYCNFNIELGTKCTITNPDPLRGLKLITDVKPEQGSNGTTVFAQPEAAFFVPMDGVMEFSEEAPEDRNLLIVRRFQPYISEAKVEQLGSNGTWEEVGNGYILRNRGLAARLRRDQILSPNTEHRVNIAVKVREWIGDPSGSNGTWQDYTPPGGSPREEREIRQWTTGERPDFVRTEDVAYAFPGRGQRFFLQGETIPSGGNTSFDAEFGPDQSIIDFINGGGPNGFAGLREFGYEYLIEPEKYDYFARFSRLDNPSESYQTSFLIRDRIILFKLPPFANATYYYFELVRKEKKKVEKPKKPNSRSADTQTLIGYNQDAQGENAPAAGSVSVERRRLEQGNTVNITRQTVLPHEVAPPPDEKILLRYYFRTSKYNTLTQKMAASAFQAPEVIGSDRDQLVAGLSGMDEPFDEYELRSMADDEGNLIASPFIHLGAPLNEQIFRPYRENLNFADRFSARIKSSWSCAIHQSHTGSSYCLNNASLRIAYGSGFDCAFAEHFTRHRTYLWHSLTPYTITITWTQDWNNNRVPNRCRPEIGFYYPALNGAFSSTGGNIVQEYLDNSNSIFLWSVALFGNSTNRAVSDFSDQELRTAAGLSNALTDVLPIWNSQPTSNVKKFRYDPWSLFKPRFEQVRPVLAAFSADRYNLRSYYDFTLPGGFFDKSYWVTTHNPDWGLRSGGSSTPDYEVEFSYNLQFERFINANTNALSKVRRRISAPPPRLQISVSIPVHYVMPPLNPVIGLSVPSFNLPLNLNPFRP